MKILAIDPGPTESGVVMLNDGAIEIFGKELNRVVRNFIRVYSPEYKVVIEMIASYGMSVGESVFRTCVEIGRFTEAYHETCGLMPLYLTRKEVGLHICNHPRANDSTIRTALIDRYGPPGTKKNPGITYGFSKDMWAALAVATTYYDMQKAEDSANALAHATLISVLQ